MTSDGGIVPNSVLFTTASYSGAGNQHVVQQDQVGAQSQGAYVGGPDTFAGGAGVGAWPIDPPPNGGTPSLLFSVDAAGNGQSLSGPVLDTAGLPGLIAAIRAKCAP